MIGSIDAPPKPLYIDTSGALEHRHRCGRKIIIANSEGIEFHCDKCGAKDVITWRALLIMMLIAQAR